MGKTTANLGTAGPDPLKTLMAAVSIAIDTCYAEYRLPKKTSKNTVLDWSNPNPMMQWALAANAGPPARPQMGLPGPMSAPPAPQMGLPGPVSPPPAPPPPAAEAMSIATSKASIGVPPADASHLPSSLATSKAA